MNEKFMVADTLDASKTALTSYQSAITECANIELRQTLQQLRNSCENFQYEVYKIANAKGYYTPAQASTQEEITTVKNTFTN